ncbi:MAG: hypothetical protein ACRECV_13010 [Xanthobacteraceae bacterium]
MPKTVLAALFGAAILSGATLATPAAAMTLAPLPAGPAANAALLDLVTNVCGINGCVPIHVRRVRKPPAGFVKRAAPLVFPIASTAQKLPAKK